MNTTWHRAQDVEKIVYLYNRDNFTGPYLLRDTSAKFSKKNQGSCARSGLKRHQTTKSFALVYHIP